MKYTLGQAAKATGKDPATISRALNKGKISGDKDEHGQWQIDPAELHRVYPATQERKGIDATPNASLRNADYVSENRVLQAQLEALRDQLERVDSMHQRERDRLETQIEDLRAERDEWREDSKIKTRLLEDQRQKEPALPPQKVGLWARLFG